MHAHGRFGKEYLERKARKTLEISELAVSGCGLDNLLLGVAS